MSGVSLYSLLKSWIEGRNAADEQAIEHARDEIQDQYEEKKREIDQDSADQKTRHVVERSHLEDWVQQRDAALEERRKNFEAQNLEKRVSKEPPKVDISESNDFPGEMEENEEEIEEEPPLYVPREIRSGSNFGRDFGKNFGKGFGKGDEK
ncbi:MAG: hypothetical protein KR126chlam3_00884 [Chlamydiae bacterium]|nr:hypothetical protein [Chlamydiota bacterium]